MDMSMKQKNIGMVFYYIMQNYYVVCEYIYKNNKKIINLYVNLFIYNLAMNVVNCY